MSEWCKREYIHIKKHWLEYITILICILLIILSIINKLYVSTGTIIGILSLFIGLRVKDKMINNKDSFIYKYNRYRKIEKEKDNNIFIERKRYCYSRGSPDLKIAQQNNYVANELGKNYDSIKCYDDNKYIKSFIIHKDIKDSEIQSLLDNYFEINGFDTLEKSLEIIGDGLGLSRPDIVEERYRKKAKKKFR